MVTRADVAELYVATFDRAPDADGLDYWTSSPDFTIDMIAKTFFDQKEAQELYPEGTSNDAFVIEVYKNLFNRLPDTAGYDFWVDALDNGQISRSNTILAFINGAQGSDATILDNKAEVGLYYADQGGEGGDFYLEDIDETEASVNNGKAAVDSELSETADFSLTANQDLLAGTAGNDSFLADVVQVDGYQVNSLATGDNLQGLTGEDVLEAQVTEGAFLGGGNMAVQPRTNSIETVKLEALESDLAYAGDDEISDVDVNTEVYVSAKNMLGVDELWSWHSDANLTIQNMTTLDSNGSTRSLSDLTIGMGYSGNDDSAWDESDFAVYFDQDYLNPELVYTDKYVSYELMNEDGYDIDPSRPLDGVIIDRLDFELNGTIYELAPLIEEDVNGTGGEIVNYADLLAAITAAVDTLKANNPDDLELQKLVVQTGANFTSDNNRTGTAIDLVVPGAQDDGTPNVLVANEQWAQLDPAEGENVVENSNRWESADETTPDNTQELRINVALEKVGLAAEGGDLVIGSMSKDGLNTWGDDTAGRGIEIFDVTVYGDDSKPSDLNTLRSTNNVLTTINVVSEERDDESYADLTIRNIKDIQTFNASEFKGNLSLLNAQLTNEIVAKYMNLQDTATDSSADNITFNYDLGIADDVLNLTMSNANLEVAGTTTREDFVLEINGNAGDDSIHTIIGNGDGTDSDNWYKNSKENANLNIDAGSGNDEVHTEGAGDFVIDAGSGDDTVYTDNDGMNSATGVNEVQTLVVAELDMLTAGQGNYEITIDLNQNGTIEDNERLDVPVLAAAADDEGAIADDIAAALNGWNVLGVAGADFAATVTDTVAAAEVQTITFNQDVAAAGAGDLDILLGEGTAVTAHLADSDTTAQIASKFANEVNVSGVATATVNGSTVTVTYTTPGDVTGMTLSGGTATFADVAASDIDTRLGAAATIDAAASTVTVATPTDGVNASQSSTIVVEMTDELANTDVAMINITTDTDTPANDIVLVEDNLFNTYTTVTDDAVPAAAGVTSERQDVDFTQIVVTADGAGRITVGETFFTVADNDDAAAIEDAMVAQLNGTDIDGDGIVDAVVDTNTGVAQVTFGGTADHTALEINDETAGFGLSAAAVTDLFVEAEVTAGGAGDAEVNTITITPNLVAAANGNITLTTNANAINVALAAGDDANTIAQKMAAALNGADVDATGAADIATASGNVVTITDSSVNEETATGAVTSAIGFNLVSSANVSVSGTETTEAADVGVNAAQWSVNAVDTDDATDLDSLGTGTTGLLYGAEVTVTYSTAQDAGSTGVTAAAAAAYTNGFESVATIGTTGNLGDMTNINQAIKDAIIGDGVEGGADNGNVMEELLTVNDGPANTIVIDSLIDGQFAEDDLAITITAATYTELSASEQSSLQATVKDLLNDSAAPDYTDAFMQTQLDNAAATANAGLNLDILTVGAASTAASDNTVTLNTGDDVLVLGTGAQSNDTVVFVEGGNGTDTIVNFTQTGTAMDYLDFTAYLDESTSASGSAASAIPVANTLNVDNIAALGEVTVINDFAQDLGAAGTADDETWANLTAEALRLAVNDESTDALESHGNIVEATLNTAGDIADHTGDYNHIVMVENDLNDGEYKIFNLVATDSATGDFTGAELIGVVDFGNTLDGLSDATFV